MYSTVEMSTNPRVFRRTYWLLQNIRCSSLLTNAMLVLTRDMRTPFLLGKTDYFVYEKNESRNHFNFFYFVQKKIFSGRNHELTKINICACPEIFCQKYFVFLMLFSQVEIALKTNVHVNGQ